MSLNSLADEEKAFLGISYKAIKLKDYLQNSEWESGIYIRSIIPDTTADYFGLQNGDIIVEIEKKKFNNKKNTHIEKYFREHIAQRKKGDTLTLTLIRFNEEFTLQQKNHNQKKDTFTRKEWIDFLNTQKYDTQWNFSVNKNSLLHTLEITLGNSPFIKNDIPSNQKLFPEYEAFQFPLEKEIVQLVQKYEKTASFDTLLSQYENNQKNEHGCRVPFIRYLHRAPHKTPNVIDLTVENFYNTLHEKTLTAFIYHGAALLNKEFLPINLPPAPTTLNWEIQLNYINEIFQLSQKLQTTAIKKLTDKEKTRLKKYFHTLQDEIIKKFGIRDNKELTLAVYEIKKLIQKIDIHSLYQSAWVLSHLTHTEWLKNLQNLWAIDKSYPPALSHYKNIAITGEENNRHTDKKNIIIDFSGNDYYALQKIDTNRIIIDLSGDDFYSSTSNYQQGGSILSVNIYADIKGNDNYLATRLAQGSAFLGVGLLYDKYGNDTYQASEFAQGTAFYGIGAVIDEQGNDTYNATLFAQAVGICQGLGALIDMHGDDQYRSGLAYPSSYKIEGSFHGASQGMGFGIRSFFDGGIGMLIDGSGKDTFYAGNFSQGSGYYFGLGILANRGSENDNYNAFRYAQGSSAHSAIGTLIEYGGDDIYKGYVGALQSAAWDISVATLWDKDGNDRYLSHGTFFSLANAAHNGFAIFVDSNGKDFYHTSSFTTTTQNSYHGGISLSFFFDKGQNTDIYSVKNINNNTQWVKNTLQFFYDGN